MQPNKQFIKDVLYRDALYLNDRLNIFAHMTNQENIWDWTWDKFPIKTPCSILEVGAGFGGFWQNNADKLPQGCSITLTDISPGMLAVCRKNVSACTNFNPIYMQADVEQLPFANHSFDSVFAHFILYYANCPLQALKELKRILKPNGIASIFTMHSESNKKLYEIAHAIDARFPVKDVLLENFCEENAENYLSIEFTIEQKHRYSTDIIIHAGAALEQTFRSIAQTYNLPYSTSLFESYCNAVDAHCKAYGSLTTSTCSTLYICRGK